MNFVFFFHCYRNDRIILWLRQKIYEARIRRRYSYVATGGGYPNHYIVTVWRFENAENIHEVYFDVIAETCVQLLDQSYKMCYRTISIVE